VTAATPAAPAAAPAVQSTESTGTVTPSAAPASADSGTAHASATKRHDSTHVTAHRSSAEKSARAAQGATGVVPSSASQSASAAGTATSTSGAAAAPSTKPAAAAAAPSPGAAPSASTAAETTQTAAAAPKDTSGLCQTINGANGAQPQKPGADPLAVDQAEYDGWKMFHVYCYRCHGEDAMGSNFAPNLRHSVGPEGTVNHACFIYTVTNGRLEKGMPTWKALLDPTQMENIWHYLQARSSGRLAPGRPHLAGAGKSGA
jgi:mono/diheme cytochrome c family protein